METIITAKRVKHWMRIFVCLCISVIIGKERTVAQQQEKIYTIKNGRMYIEVSRDLSEGALDSFIRKFNLAELGLKGFIKKNITDSIKNSGWSIDANTNEKIIAISRLLASSDDNLSDPAQQFILSTAERFPPIAAGLVIGYNKFKNNLSFDDRDSAVRFFLRNHQNAKRVILAGSFNSFSTDALPMKRTDSGWTAEVSLGPGKYWYKFIIDGNREVDEDNLLRENDGRGNTNSVFYKTNMRFHLDGHKNAKKVFIAGTFNNWQPNDIRMNQTSTGWELPLYLAAGTYTYRYIADGNWFADSANPEKVPNEFDEFNSVIRVGSPYLFRLFGFNEAKRVFLMGSFNGWRKEELFMKKTESGWELPYTLGLGNYEYKFVIDGTEITDPTNSLFTNNDRKTGNSILILGANYTFHLKGYPDAKLIYLAGDFNNFSEQAFPMNKKGDEWTFAVHLSPGKYLYKFVVDGKWIIDPANKLWEQNEYGTGNSVIWIDPVDALRFQQ